MGTGGGCCLLCGPHTVPSTSQAAITTAHMQLSTGHTQSSSELVTAVFTVKEHFGNMLTASFKMLIWTNAMEGGCTKTGQHEEIPLV